MTRTSLGVKAVGVCDVRSRGRGGGGAGRRGGRQGAGLEASDALGERGLGRRLHSTQAPLHRFDGPEEAAEMIENDREATSRVLHSAADIRKLVSNQAEHCARAIHKG